MKNRILILGFSVLFILNACKKDGIENLEIIDKEFASLPDNGSGNSFSDLPGSVGGNNNGSNGNNGNNGDNDDDDGNDGDGGNGGNNDGELKIVSNTISINGSSKGLDAFEFFEDSEEHAFYLYNSSEDIGLGIESYGKKFSQGLIIGPGDFKSHNWYVEYEDEDGFSFEAYEYAEADQGNIKVVDFNSNGGKLQLLTLEFFNVKCTDPSIQETITINGRISISR